MKKKTTKFATPSTIILLFVSGVAVLIFSSVLWWNGVYTDYERTFWSTVDNNLRTSSVVKQTNSDQQTQLVSQTQILSFNGDPFVDNDVNIRSASGQVTVQTLGFSDQDYLRYTQLDLTNEEQNLAVQDALGVWSTPGRDAGNPELLSESFLASFVLHGNLDHTSRSSVVADLREAYIVDFQNVTESEIDGTKVFVYEVEIDIAKYVDALKQYLVYYGQAELADEIGAPSSQQPIFITLKINPKSRQIMEVATTDSTESYSAQGIRYTSDRPAADIGYDELQTLLSE